MINLCNNAAHAMRDQGGILEVNLSNIRIFREMLIIHPDLKEGAYVLLTIRDTGHGVDPTIKDKIFDPFFTTKPPKEGTGLGLSVVYGIIRSHGGAISMQSDLGVGTTFSIYLPGVDRGEATQSEQIKIDLRGGGERILFVDDEKSLAEIVPAFLGNLGYEVVATTGSLDALRLFTKNPECFDMVITDMTMPHMTGLEMSGKMLALRGDIPIILCTGYHESVTWNEVKKRGIKELVMKPISLTDLGLLIRRTFDGDPDR
jgi:CheY-like chemotaxis protein